MNGDFHEDNMLCIVQKIHANYTVSLSELRNPSASLSGLVKSSGPVAVMEHDKALFYVVSRDWLHRLHESGGDPGRSLSPATPIEIAPPTSSPLTFAEVAQKMVLLEASRALRGAYSSESVAIVKGRLNATILPVLGHVLIGEVQADQLQALINRMAALERSATTMSQHLVIVRKVLKLAWSRKWISEIPEIPKITIQNQPRSTFSVGQYKQMLRTAKQLVRQGALAPCVKESVSGRERFWVTPKYRIMPQDMYWLIGFMVNSFVRPSDIKLMQHKHIEVIRGERVYLRLTLPTTKKHDKPIVTLRPAVRIYESLLAKARSDGYAGPDDYLFLPKEKNREHVLAVMNFWLKWILREAGLALSDNRGQARTLYCLRHTAITFRLLYGQGIDMLTLARNARTSVDMIENFYASTLEGEMNVGMLQSRRVMRQK